MRRSQRAALNHSAESDMLLQLHDQHLDECGIYWQDCDERERENEVYMGENGSNMHRF